MVGLFDDLVGPFRIYICDTKFLGCAVCYNLAKREKGPCLSPK